MVASYEQSVHGQAVAAGSEKAAVCTDCHGTHEILDAKDAKSPIFKFNVPSTCGQCHDAVSKEFQAEHSRASACEGQLASAGLHRLPRHPLHQVATGSDILRWRRRISRRRRAPAATKACGCRRSSASKAAAKPPIWPAITDSRPEAVRKSSPTAPVAMACTTFFPSTDPRSTINHANLARTCGQCHPGVTEKFTAGKVHVDAPFSADIGSKAVHWIRRFYLGMIFAVIGGMLLHNFIIWRSKVMARRKTQHDFVMRMPLRFRLQHGTLLTSFFVLVVTGFALKFPDSWFASMLSLGERMRGTSCIASQRSY